MRNDDSVTAVIKLPVAREERTMSEAEIIAKLVKIRDDLEMVQGRIDQARGLLEELKSRAETHYLKETARAIQIVIDLLR